MRVPFWLKGLFCLEPGQHSVQLRCVHRRLSRVLLSLQQDGDPLLPQASSHHHFPHLLLNPPNPSVLDEHSPRAGGQSAQGRSCRAKNAPGARPAGGRERRSTAVCARRQHTRHVHAPEGDTPDVSMCRKETRLTRPQTLLLSFPSLFIYSKGARKGRK